MRRGIAAWMSIGTVALSACGGAGAGSDGADTIAEYQGPIGSNDVATGEQVYNEMCASCHEGDAPALGDLGLTAAAVRRQIREGDDEMPAIPAPKLSDTDMEHVLAYLASIGTVQGGAAPAGATAGGSTGAAGEPTKGKSGQ